MILALRARLFVQCSPKYPFQIERFTIKYIIFAQRFRNNKNKMQQNRMNITATNVCRGSKRLEGVLCAHISSIVSFDNIGKTIQQKHTQTRIL